MAAPSLQDSTAPDRRGRHWGLMLALCVAVVTALVATTSVYAIRRVLHQDLVESAAAQGVIRAAKLHALAERMGGHARGYLLTADPSSFDRVMTDRDSFFEHLDRLLQTADAQARWRLQELQTAARNHDEALGQVVAMRRAGQSSEAVVRAFEEEVRPRREILDGHLAQLIQTEEDRLEALDRSTERAASRLATTATGVAGGALLVSVALAVLLARAFRSVRRKQALLEEALGRVEQANRDLDAFAGRIANDLRTPLTPITLVAEKLKRNADKDVVRAAERIERNAQAANQMLEELLAFSRLGHERPAGSARAAAAIGATLEDLAQRIAEAGVTVETTLDDESVVACSEALFREVVGNLAGNAIKFMAGCPERRLKVILQARSGACELEVHDTGPGIPPEALERIFEPFYRVPGIERSGSGLGLAIVRRIVDAHRGSISARSTVGRGSTFRVVLPAAPAVSDPGSHPASAPAVQAAL